LSEFEDFKLNDSKFAVKDLIKLEKGSKISKESSKEKIDDENIKKPLIIQDNKQNNK